MRGLKRFFAALLVLALLAGQALAAGPEPVWNAQLGGKTPQAWLNGPAREAPQNETWLLLALRQKDPTLDFSRCRAALERYAAETPPGGAVSRLRVALTLLALGSDSTFVEKTANEDIGGQGLMSLVFGLHLLNNGAACANWTTDTLADAILALQLEDGGWCVTGAQADTDTTAMALQALAPQYGARAEVTQAVERGLALLSARQLETGGFAGVTGENAESAAQVLLALDALSIDCQEDGRFIKNGNRLPDVLAAYQRAEGFAHSPDSDTVNAMATAQALCALTALETEGSFYRFSVPLTPTRWGTGWKLWAYAAIGAAALLSCLIAFLRGKRGWRTYVFLLAAGAVLCAGVSLLRIESTAGYYAPPADAAATQESFLAIRCDRVAGAADHIPADGAILAETAVLVAPGETALEQLIRAARANGISLDYSGGYVSGIANLYEFDFGELSGWVFRVNGATSSAGCGDYVLQPGDRVEWVYTTQLGQDVP